ncbi:hypothetical protein BDR04DRAFT_1137932 [Suillus decipiens]|nr:hypothetical protein BDR04DRAFT_1137932 [Suillus decipiens]
MNLFFSYRSVKMCRNWQAPLYIIRPPVIKGLDNEKGRIRLHQTMTTSQLPPAPKSLFLCLNSSSSFLGQTQGQKGSYFSAALTLLIFTVIQHNLPTEGGVEGKMRDGVTGETSDGDKINITLEGASIESVLAKGFGIFSCPTPSDRPSCKNIRLVWSAKDDFYGKNKTTNASNRRLAVEAGQQDD